MQCASFRHGKRSYHSQNRCLAEEVISAARIKLVLNLEAGQQIFGWPKADGSFSIHGVPEGTHLLDVIALGLIYPQVGID